MLGHRLHEVEGVQIQHHGLVVVGSGGQMEPLPEHVPGHLVRLQQVVERAEPPDPGSSRDAGLRDGVIARRVERDDLVDRAGDTFGDVEGDPLRDERLFLDLLDVDRHRITVAPHRGGTGDGHPNP